MIRSSTFDAYGSTLCIGGDAQGLRVVNFPTAAAAAGGLDALMQGNPVKPLMVLGGGGGPSKCSSANDIVSVKVIARVGSTPLVAFVGSVRTNSQSTAPSSRAVVMTAAASSATPAPQSHRIMDSDRCVHVYDISTNTLLANIFFEAVVLAIQINTARLVVILEKATYVFQLPSLEQLSFIPTEEPVNRLGLGTLSQVDPVYENCFFAFPLQASFHRGAYGDGSRDVSMVVASKAAGGAPLPQSTGATTGGDVMILDAIDLAPISSIQAHRQPLAAIQFSANGTRLATCSSEGTNIKVWSNPSCALLYQLRRGNMTASVRVLAFNHMADMLVVAGEGGTIHLFYCGSGSSSSATAAHGDGRSGAVAAGSTRSFAKIYIPVASSNSSGTPQGDHLGGGKSIGAVGPSSLAKGKCRLLCAFSDDSRILRVVVERWDTNAPDQHRQLQRTGRGASAAAAGGGGGLPSILTILAQYRVDREANKVYEAVLGSQ